MDVIFPRINNKLVHILYGCRGLPPPPFSGASFQVASGHHRHHLTTNLVAATTHGQKALLKIRGSRDLWSFQQHTFRESAMEPLNFSSAKLNSHQINSSAAIKKSIRNFMPCLIIPQCADRQTAFCNPRQLVMIMMMMMMTLMIHAQYYSQISPNLLNNK